MSKEYYLVSQLPALEAFSGEAPINEERFKELCSRFLKGKEREAILTLSLIPPKSAEFSTGNKFLDAWYAKERRLRCALASVRAEGMKRQGEVTEITFDASEIQTARTAYGMKSPLEAEKFLYDYRLSCLDEMESGDYFSTDVVFAYGIRLLLLLRAKRFDTERGKESYKKIYDTILGEAI